MKTNNHHKSLQNYKKKVSATVESSIEFLTQLGVISKNGIVNEQFKDICIPKEQI